MKILTMPQLNEIISEGAFLIPKADRLEKRILWSRILAHFEGSGI